MACWSGSLTGIAGLDCRMLLTLVDTFLGLRTHRTTKIPPTTAKPRMLKQPTIGSKAAFATGDELSERKSVLSSVRVSSILPSLWWSIKILTSPPVP